MKQKDMYGDFKFKITLRCPCFVDKYFSALRVNSYWNFVKLKNPKIREKLRSGWVKHQLRFIFLISNFMIFLCCCVVVLFSCFECFKILFLKNGYGRGGGGFGSDQPKFFVTPQGTTYMWFYRTNHVVHIAYIYILGQMRPLRFISPF